MDHLPESWSVNKKAWFTKDVFPEWRDVFLLDVRQVHMKKNEKKVFPRKHVPVVLLLDDTPAHPPMANPHSSDRRIRVEFLPTNTTSVIQPMYQNVFENHYRRLLLNQILVVELVNEGEEDTRKQLTLGNLKNHNLQILY